MADTDEGRTTFAKSVRHRNAMCGREVVPSGTCRILSTTVRSQVAPTPSPLSSLEPDPSEPDDIFRFRSVPLCETATAGRDRTVHVHGCLNGAGVSRVYGLCGSCGLAVPRPVQLLAALVNVNCTVSHWPCCQLMRIVWSRTCRSCHAKACCPSCYARPPR